MQITRQSDYATRAILYLARVGKGERVTTSQVAKEQKIPPSFLAKIISQLSIAGLLHTSRRARGGVGGQLDFIYGASRSKGGVPIIALPSTTTLKDGALVTRIASMLKQGAGVVTSRNHMRYVVTEYGVADLYGKTIRQRAQQFISIAHPDFRLDLERQAKELHYL